MRIIYCDSVVDARMVEPDFDEEKRAAEAAGFSTSLISFEELTEGSLARALRFVKVPNQQEPSLYRGWMLTPTQYERLYTGLQERNLQLINTPGEYKHCHYLPASYDRIASKTPRSVWTTALDKLSIATLIEPFGGSSLIVKDFVKSEKHHWEEACFIPKASDTDQVMSVVGRLLELRGDAFNEGLVFRQFEALEFLADHSKSGMPLTKEFRLFFWQGDILAVFDYWEEGDYGQTKPELDDFKAIGRAVDSKFFTMDIAKKKDGDWIIMELGDGQVAGLPESVDRLSFYRGIKERWAKMRW